MNVQGGGRAEHWKRKHNYLHNYPQALGKGRGAAEFNREVAHENFDVPFTGEKHASSRPQRSLS